MNISRLLKYHFVTLLMLLAHTVGNTQVPESDTYLEIKGIAEYMMDPLENATVELYEGNKKVDAITTPRNGRFEFYLNKNKTYTVVVSKDGYVSKQIMFITDMPDGVTGKWTAEFAIGLLKPCEGVNYSLLEKPVDKISFHERKNEFVSSRDYTMDIRDRMEDLVYEMEKCLLEKYAEIIAQADKLYRLKQYKESRQQYMLATQADPYDRYPIEQIDKINQLLAQQQITDQQFNETVDIADNHFKYGNLNLALTYYQQAKNLKPGDAYVNGKITEVKSRLNTEKANELAEAEKEREFKSFVTRGEAAFTSGNYAVAKEMYTQAAQLKPGEALPKQRLMVIETQMEKNKQALEAKQQKQEQSKALVNQADNLLQLGEHQQALAKYQQALSLVPNQPYAAQKVNEINQYFENQNKKENDFNRYLTQGDQMLSAGKLAEAKQAYQAALLINSGSQVVKNKISNVNQLIVEKDREEQFAKQQQANYERAIKKADALNDAGNLAEALNAYQEALQYKSADSYATQKAAIINEKLVEQEKAQAKAEEINRKYNETIKTADNLFTLEEYSSALASYRRAKLYKPNEPYPDQKINEINQKLQEIQRQNLLEQQKRARYNEIITRADLAFENENYQTANKEYQQALQILPNESYPREQLLLVNNIMQERRDQLAKQQAIDQKYAALIEKADNAMFADNLEEAKQSYLLASNLKPAEPYPKEQIHKITEQLAAINANRMEEERLQRLYDEAIASADNFFNAKNYAAARSKYQAASQAKPDESYPKKRVKQIDEILALLNNNKPKQSAPAPTASKKNLDNEIKKLYFQNKSAKADYINNLKNNYPEGITKEVYKGEFKTMNRYIIKRGNNVDEFREIEYSWGKELYHFDILTTPMFFRQQTSVRENERINTVVK